MPEITFRQQGSEHRLLYAGFEGAVALTANGRWYWWVRSASQRFAGETSTLKSARATLVLVINKIEAGEDPEFYLGG